MSVQAAYIGVILIWTTTPLAIKWSGEGPGFLFGVTGRMVIGVLLAMLLLQLLGKRLVWHKKARQTYLAGGLGIYGAMLLVYWGAQFIPSGWVSVIFGLAPIITGLMTIVLLEHSELTMNKFVGLLFGIAGLAIVFIEGVQFSPEVLLGMIAVVLSALVHSTSAVFVKKIGAALPGMTITTGSLLVAVLLFLFTWFISGAHWPQDIGFRSAASIIYLGVIGSVIGFALYFYILTHMQATSVSLITLITPVLALILGTVANNEIISGRVWAGVVIISLGLMMFQFGHRLKSAKAV